MRQQKYAYRVIEKKELALNFKDKSSRIGSGASGVVFRGSLHLGGKQQVRVLTCLVACDCCKRECLCSILSS